MRLPVAGLAALLLACSPTFAASPAVDAAVKVFNAVAADAGKLKIFCEMSKVLEAAGDKEDPTLDAQVDGFMDQLGDDFATAWEAGEGLAENSPDAQAFEGAVEALEAKCT
jgi:hypothetical protein